MVAPEGYGLVDKVPTLDERRGLILVSKAIQNLSNGVQFGSKVREERKRGREKFEGECEWMEDDKEGDSSLLI